MWRNNLPGFLLPWENRDRYYDALEECNSKEPGLWGNLTDLTNLFCDVLENSVEQSEEMEMEADEVADESTVVDDYLDDSEFSRLIAELKGSGKATPLNFKEQYDDWFNTISAVVSEIKELSAQLSRVFRAEWQGEVYAKDFSPYRHRHLSSHPNTTTVCSNMVPQNRIALSGWRGGTRPLLCPKF